MSYGTQNIGLKVVSIKGMAPHKQFGVSADVSTRKARRLSTLELTACPKKKFPKNLRKPLKFIS